MTDSLTDRDLERLMNYSKESLWTDSQEDWVRMRLGKLVEGYGVHSHPDIPAASETESKNPPHVTLMQDHADRLREVTKKHPKMWDNVEAEDVWQDLPKVWELIDYLKEQIRIRGDAQIPLIQQVEQLEEKLRKHHCGTVQLAQDPMIKVLDAAVVKLHKEFKQLAEQQLSMVSSPELCPNGQSVTDLKRAVRNLEERLLGTDSVECPRCNGNGMWNLTKCGTCAGHGFIPNPKVETCGACQGSGEVTRDDPTMDQTCTVCDGRGIISSADPKEKDALEEIAEKVAEDQTRCKRCNGVGHIPDGISRPGCPDCKGTGRKDNLSAQPETQIDTTCLKCGGTGLITEVEGFKRTSARCPVCEGEGHHLACRYCGGIGWRIDNRNADVNTARWKVCKCEGTGYANHKDIPKQLPCKPVPRS